MDKISGKILTKEEFNSSPYKNLMSYEDYFQQALKFGSAFTIARALTLNDAKETSEKINDSVQGFYLEREARKDEAEEKYYAALEQYNLMKNSNKESLSQLNYATNIYGEGSSKYTDALKKYNLSNKTLFGADINLSCARDQFNFANTSAFKAYLSTQLT